MVNRNEFFENYQMLREWINKEKPLVHHITNNVTVNDCASITLNWGGLPVMAPGIEEAELMVEAASALVLNIGTLDDTQLAAMIKAGKKANELDIPVVFDPVGAGATPYRTGAVEQILNKVDLSVIKGNKGEISIMAGEEGEVKGVESVGKYRGIKKSAAELAQENNCIVVVSGKQDVISSEKNTISISSGHHLMGEVVGTGCMLSSTLGIFIAGVINLGLDSFDAAAAAVFAFNLAGEIAAEEISTPAHFKVEFMDTVYSMSSET